MHGAWVAKRKYLKERIVLFLLLPILELLSTCLHLMLGRTSSQYERMEDIMQVHRIGLPRQLDSLGHGERGTGQLGVEATTANQNSISNRNVVAVRLSTPWDLWSVFLQSSTTNKRMDFDAVGLSLLFPAKNPRRSAKPRRNN